MKQASSGRKLLAKVVGFVLSIAMVFTMMPLNMNSVSYAATSSLTTQTPVVVATGTGLLGGAYSADNISREKSYTLDELKQLDGVSGQMYSGRKSKYPYTKIYTYADGVKIESLLGGLSLSDITDTVSLIAEDGYGTSFVKGATYTNDGKTKNKPGLDGGRYYYEDFDAAKATEVPAIISWAYTDVEGKNGEVPTSYPTSATENNYLRSFVGQYESPDDMNGPLYNGKEDCSLNMVQVGDAITETALSLGTEEFTRADILMKDFAERTFNYETSNGSASDAVRGVPMSVLLEGYDDKAVVHFEAADGYAVSADGLTVKELIEGNFILAYEVNGAGLYSTKKKDPSVYGFFNLYGDGDYAKPAKMVNKITVTTPEGIDFSTSPYKHITNGGISGQSGPYDIDAITGATLTIEGPGTVSSVPLSVRDMENQNNGCHRGVYTDSRNGVDTERTYEGVDLYHILNNMQSGVSGIKLTDKAYQVQIKNRNRKTIATLTLDQIEQMHNDGKPAIVSYGTAMADGTNPRPYVFTGSTGEDKELGNNDGCLKFVYDYKTYSEAAAANPDYTKFSNMAYIYVEEKEEPGFKHDKEPYNTAENSKYVLTLTGDEIGREVNITVEELEELVQYDENGNVVDNGYGYRDEYSLANSSYWYVNEYEGVKLWSLLQRAGITADKAEDDKTMVTFQSTDNYLGFDKFSLKQVADPDTFGFYEKNANDKSDGTYQPNENIRQGDDVNSGDKIKAGYPVLVSYGVNNYPYVVNKGLDGYLSGLSNDGGPLRVISGKLNYNHANGSNQAKLLDKVIVGENNYHYSTHAFHSNKDYTDLKDNKLNVAVMSGDTEIKSKEYTIEDLETLIYGGSLTPTQLAEAKIKNYYQIKKNGQLYSDLYEGLNLNYFLKNVLELQGSEGSITFTSSTGAEMTMQLADVLATNNGYNSETGLSDLSPVIAYAKNGAPLVQTSESAGYEKNVTLAKGTDYENKINIKNDRGPLQIIFPMENSSADDTMGSLDDVVSISVNLEADQYAHVKAPYDTYANTTITVSGEGTRISGSKEFTVSDLEGKQSIISTQDFSVLNSKGNTKHLRYTMSLS